MEYNQVVSLPYGQKADSGTEPDFSMTSDHDQVSLHLIGRKN